MAIVTTNKYLTYNEEYHMYIPLPALLQDKLNYDVYKTIGEKEGNIWLEDMAWFIKDLCNDCGNFDNFDEHANKIEHMIYLNGQGQVLALQRAYVEAFRYALNDEGDQVGIQTGLNIIKGQIIPIAELRGRRELSSRLERILRNSLLMYGGKLNWDIDEDDGVRGTDY